MMLSIDRTVCMQVFPGRIYVQRTDTVPHGRQSQEGVAPVGQEGQPFWIWVVINKVELQANYGHVEQRPEPRPYTEKGGTETLNQHLQTLFCHFDSQLMH